MNEDERGAGNPCLRSNLRVGPVLLSVVLAAVALIPAASGATTTRVSVSTSGAQGDCTLCPLSSGRPAISASGRFVAFDSGANLVARDTNDRTDIFLRDRDADRDGIFDEAGAVRTLRVSVGTNGSQANSGSLAPAISASGRFVAYWSDASNLVARDTNDRGDIFVRDRDVDRDGIFDEAEAVRTRRISVSSAGTQANASSSFGGVAISTNGRFIAFSSKAGNLTRGDTNKKEDVFVRDRDTDRDGVFDETGAATTRRISVSTTGQQANADRGSPTMSRTGRFITFFSVSLWEHDVFVRDRDTDRDGVFDERGAVLTRRLSVSASGRQANGESYVGGQIISASGRFVTFMSDATNIAAGDTNDLSDIFVRDRDTDRDGLFDEKGAVRTRRVSISTAGEQADGDSWSPAISADGRFVVFSSQAMNLVAPEPNVWPGIFIRDRDTDRDGVFDESGAVRTSGLVGTHTFELDISARGRHLAFTTHVPLVDGDTNQVDDVFVYGPLFNG